MHACVCMCICMYVRTYVRTYVGRYVCMYIGMYVSIYISIYLYVSIYLCTCVSVCPCVCVSVCLCARLSVSLSLSKDDTQRKDAPSRRKGKAKAKPQNPSTSNSPETASNGNAHDLNCVSTVIIGDSIISKVQGWRMSDNSNRISVKSFSGAKVEDMSHYIKPTLAHSPDNVILHIGTNNLKKDNPDVLCNKIETLCKAIQKESPNTKLALSEITPRHDFKDASNAREQVNKKLEALCGAKNFLLLNILL